MDNKTPIRKRKTKSLVPLIIVLSIVLLALCVVVGAAVAAMMTGKPAETAPQTEAPQTEAKTEPPETLPPETEAPETKAPETDPPAPPPVTYTDVTLLSAGDIMFHNKQVLTALGKDGQYSFTDVFQYLNPIVSKYDYAVANLESPFGGEAYPYTESGSITFNAPDTALDAIKGAGFDLCLFANNHTYDCSLDGLRRTVKTLRDGGVESLGARESASDSFNKVVDVKGVKIGMLNYTNDGTWSTEANNTINGRALTTEARKCINLFYLSALGTFYDDVQSEIARLKSEGADLIVTYIHWGREYYTEPDETQKKIAQKLCDLGVDVLIGSHPHVIQPAETLTSTVDPSHKTFCLYSTGNFVSNQNRSSLSENYCHGNNVNTENGLMLILKIRRYSTGETLVTGIETEPTWVQRFKGEDGIYDYRIIPLREAVKDPEAFGLNRSSNYTGGKTTDKELAEAALAMTDAMLGGSVSAFNEGVTLPQIG